MIQDLDPLFYTITNDSNHETWLSARLGKLQKGHDILEASVIFYIGVSNA
jgi:hypothetical protein